MSCARWLRACRRRFAAHDRGMMDAELPFVGPWELGRLTGLSPRWLAAEARAGRLPAIQSRRGQIAFPVDAALRALEQRAVAAMSTMKEGA